MSEPTEQNEQTRTTQETSERLRAFIETPDR